MHRPCCVRREAHRDCCGKESMEIQEIEDEREAVTVEEPPISFSPLTLADCTLFSHFSFNDFIAIAFLDLTEDLDIHI